MSSIDAAIIKALVEHIAGGSNIVYDLDFSKLEPRLDPDQVTWETMPAGGATNMIGTLSDESYTYHLEPMIGDMLLFKKSNGTIVRMVCTDATTLESDSADKTVHRYTYYKLNDGMLGAEYVLTQGRAGDTTLELNNIRERDLEDIDNVETGFFRYNADNNIIKYLQAIFNGLTEVSKTIKSSTE